MLSLFLYRFLFPFLFLFQFHFLFLFLFPFLFRIPDSGFPLFQTPYPRFITATFENLYVVAYEMLNLLYILSSLF